MGVNDLIFKEFVKNGYAEAKGYKVWDISDRRFLYLTPKLAKGFLRLRKFEPYRKQVVEREINLMRENSEKMVKDLNDDGFNLVDVYCGDGTKAAEFIKNLKGFGKIRYCPVNVNEFLTNLAIKNVQKNKFNNVVEYSSRICECDAHKLGEHFNKMRDDKFKRNVVLLFGSVLASYQVNDYLYGLSKNMKKGDYLIIGNGIRTGERLVSLETYKHKIWDKWFINLMKGLGFSAKDVKYDARFGNSRVEMFYKLNKDKEIKHKDKSISFKKGDEILTAILYKYYAEELEKFCKMYFSKVNLVEDKDGEYALVICRK